MTFDEFQFRKQWGPEVVSENLSVFIEERICTDILDAKT